MNAKRHLLIIGRVWPEPASSAAGGRMMQLIELFQNQHWQVTFVSAATKSDFSVDLKNRKIHTAEIKLNDSSFDAFVRGLNPQLVLFDRYMTEEQFGWRVAENCPNALRILDTEDLHCLRYARQQAIKNNKTFSEADLLSDYAKREIASILRCDLSLIISTYEMDLLKNFFQVEEALLHYIPFMFEPLTNEQINQWPSYQQRKHFVSIGNFLHEPNWDAVLFLKNEIWPLIKKQLPETEVHIYGAYPSQKVFELNNPPQGFIVKGRAENAKEVLQKAKVCLAPLRFGAGLKGKLVDAMLSGTPTTTTTIGAEAMHKRLPWAGSIADETNDFSKAAIKLYSLEQEWKTAQRNGITIMNTCYPKKKSGELLLQKINLLIANTEAHRRQNFTGAMLMHHTLWSAKYLSKWIEEKNKN